MIHNYRITPKPQPKEEALDVEKKPKVSEATHKIRSQEPPDPQGVALGLLVFGSFFLFASFVLYSFATPHIRAYESKSWTQYPCKIISSQMVTKSYPRDKERKYHRVTLAYEYIVNGIAYKSSVCGFGEYDYMSDYKEAKNIADRYPAQKQTICFVNPTNPKDAVLIRELSLISLIIVATFTGPFILIGGTMFFWIVCSSARNSFENGLKSDRPLKIT